MRVAAILLVLLIAPLVSAQAPGEPLSAANNQLWGHSDGDDTKQWFNTVEQDGDGTSTGPCGSAVGAGTACTQDAFTVVFTLFPDLAGPVGLDLAGTADATVYLGGGFASGGRFDVSMQIKQGDTVIFDGPSKSHTYTPKPPTAAGAAFYEDVTWSMEPLVDRLEPGTPVTWEIHAEGEGTNPFVATSGTRGRTNIILPIVDLPDERPALTTEYLDIDGSVFELTRNGTSTNAVTIANWTAAFGNATLDVSAEGNGTARLLISDAANNTREFDLVNGTISEDLTLEPGNWTIQLSLLDYTGTVTVQIVQKAEAGPDDPPSGEPEGNATQAPGPEEDEESPMLGPVLMLLALVVMARRRDD